MRGRKVHLSCVRAKKKVHMDTNKEENYKP